MKALKQATVYGITAEGSTVTEAKAKAGEVIQLAVKSGDRANGVILLSDGTIFVVGTGFQAGSYQIHRPGDRPAPSWSGCSIPPHNDPFEYAARKACAHALQYGAPETRVIGVSAIPESIQAAAAFDGASYELDREEFESTLKKGVA